MSTPFSLETRSWVSTPGRPELFVAEKVLRRVRGNNQSRLTSETIKIYFNLSTGAIEFRDSNNNLIVSFDKDSKTPDFTSDDYDQYFSETNASTRGQYDRLLTWTKQQALAIARVPNLGYDFIRITAFEYKPGGRESLSLSNPNRGDRRGEQLETIILPMQPNFSESNAVSWGGDKLNPLQMMLGQAAAGTIESIGNADVSIAVDTFNKTIEDAKKALEDNATGPAIVAYFAGQAVGANIQTRVTGNVLNPNLELLFSGPNLRTFQFNFRMTPRDHDESLMIKKII